MHNVTLPTPDTFSDLLLTLTALSGEFPSALVKRLPGSEYYNRNAVTRMKKAGLLYKYSRDGLHGLRLTSAAKDLLLTQQPDRYSDILAGDSVLNAPKYTAVRRARLHRMAEVLVSMFNANVLVLPWEKPDIFQEDGETSLMDIDQPTYYTSLEIKGGGDQGRKFTGSQATGILFGYDNIFLTFNTGSSEMKWDSKSETRLKVFVAYNLCVRQAGRRLMKKTDAIMFASDMDQFNILMGGSKKKKSRNQTVLDDFDHFYYLTNDYYGDVILCLLCDPRLKKALDGVLMQGLSPVPYGYGGVDCDAIDKDKTPTLIGYTCDMPRIKRFVHGLITNERKGVLYCFDFQEEAVKQICGSQATIQCIDFEAAVRLLWESE